MNIKVTAFTESKKFYYTNRHIATFNFLNLLSVERDKASKSAKEQDRLSGKEPSLEDWLAKRAKRLKKDEGVKEPTEIVQYQLPPFLMNIPNLPPSLLPPTMEDFKNVTPCGWG